MKIRLSILLGGIAIIVGSVALTLWLLTPPDNTGARNFAATSTLPAVAVTTGGETDEQPMGQHLSAENDAGVGESLAPTSRKIGACDTADLAAAKRRSKNSALVV